MGEIHIPGSTREVSDGFHSFGQLYEHRAALFVTLMRAFPLLSWRSRFHEDSSMYPGFFIAGMKLPRGQISYHLEERYWDNLSEIYELPHAPKWDGHLPQDVVIRLLDWEPKTGMLKAHGDQADLSGKSADSLRSPGS